MNVPSLLPARTIPGSYGLPLVGPLKDRLDYFWFEGQDSFFKNRMAKYQSTVFRTNIPPTFPFFSGVNPKIIAVLDNTSFSALFDISLVEKKDCLIGDYMPSLDFTGKIRVGVYLDPSDKTHSLIKTFSTDTLKRSSTVWISELNASLQTMWASIEKQVSESGKSSLLVPLQKCIFNFLCKSLAGADPATTPEISECGYAMLDKWLALQLLPTVKVGIPQPLEEIFLHSFPLPFVLVKGDYQKLYDFVSKQGREVIERAEKEYGLSEAETCHNMLFVLGFNAYGGFSVFLPFLISTLGRDKSGLQEKLREEVRSVLKKKDRGLGFEAVGEMELVKSTVYEVLRLNPPVPLQFARARRDFELRTYDSAFQVNKGEMLCGYQKLAMRDPTIFREPDRFVADRFMGSGEALLEHLFWSNGPQTATPSTANKQCPAKDHVVATACMLVADIFTRYDSFRCDDSSLDITSVQKRS